MTNIPLHKLPTWQHQIYANGYLAAMNGEPINPVAPDLWLQGYELFVQSQISSASSKQLAPTSPTSSRTTTDFLKLTVPVQQLGNASTTSKQLSNSFTALASI